HFFPRFRLHRASPQNKNSTTTDDDSVNTSPPKPPSLLPHFRNDWLKFDELGMEMLSIALPAAVALAADPIASLIDTAFVGHIAFYSQSGN
ncbi:MATE efflux family protein 2 chloroplastic-like, partial [Trifolium medium]|nr:MATE efflux family protein 2 chloroplastic-like [Trifolium medium]